VEREQMEQIFAQGYAGETVSRVQEYRVLKNGGE